MRLDYLNQPTGFFHEIRAKTTQENKGFTVKEMMRDEGTYKEALDEKVIAEGKTVCEADIEEGEPQPFMMHGLKLDRYDLREDYTKALGPLPLNMVRNLVEIRSW